MAWLDAHRDLECCDVTTVGRLTGRPHQIEIWFGVDRDGDTMYVISGNGPRADWYRNALSSPLVTVRVADDTWVGTARPVTDPAERRRVGELMGSKYPWDGDPSIGLTFDAWCFDVPALAIGEWRVPDSSER